MSENVNAGGAEQPKMSFEQALARLEGIVAMLEQGTLPLEESLAKFEEGMRLSKICSDKLAEVDSKIQILVKRTDGSLGFEDYTRGQ